MNKVKSKSFEILGSNYNLSINTKKEKISDFLKKG